MTVTADKQSTVTNFEQCRENYREAAADMFHALYEHGTEEQAKTFYESMTPLYEQIEAINDRITAAKRKERIDKIAELMPRLGDEVLIDICPCAHSGETWMQCGKVVLAWHDAEQVEWSVWAAIEITRPLSPEENDGWQTDDTWNGCVFVCRLNCYSNDWRAYWPASDRAEELWGSDEDGE